MGDGKSLIEKFFMRVSSLMFLKKHEIMLTRSSSKSHIGSREDYHLPILIFLMINFQSVERHRFLMSVLEKRMSLNQVEVI